MPAIDPTGHEHLTGMIPMSRTQPDTKPMTPKKLLKLAKKADNRLREYQNIAPSLGSQKWIEVVTAFEDLLDCIDELEALNPPIKETKDAD